MVIADIVEIKKKNFNNSIKKISLAVLKIINVSPEVPLDLDIQNRDNIWFVHMNIMTLQYAFERLFSQKFQEWDHIYTQIWYQI